MRGWIRVAACLGASALVAVGCTSTTDTANNSPAASPSETASPSASPSPITSPSTEPTPSASPSPSPTPLALYVNPVSYHVGEVGIGYSGVTATATGGTAPYVWGTSGGALPPGLFMSFDGTLAGTPTAEGAFSFVVIVQDSTKAVAGLAKTINVARHMSASGSCARLCSVEAGCFTVCGSLGSVDGGARPLKVSLLSGSVPKGMSLVPLALTGAFPSPSNFSLTVQITDALGATDTVTANFNVFSHIRLFYDGAPSCVGYGCQVRIPFTLGTPNGTPSLSISNVTCASGADAHLQPCTGTGGEPPPNTLPSAGFSAVVSGGEVVIDFGSPGQFGNWYGTFVITLTDQSPCSSSSNCTTTIQVNIDNWVGYG